MYIKIVNTFGMVDFQTSQFDQFRALVAEGKKIHAIKFLREMVPSWGLKECKDYVEACYFAPTPSTSARVDDDFLADMKDDLRAILLDKSEYRESLLLDLYGRVCSERGKRQ